MNTNELKILEIEREAFELAVQNEGYDTCHLKYFDDTDSYELTQVQDMWWAWQARAKALQSSEPVALTVWENAMPESNGKSNFTAILMRKGGELHEGMTIARSEYPDRVRYEAEHDALVADAERYRWLCENKQVPWGLFIKNAHELGIDQAIDSAKGK